MQFRRGPEPRVTIELAPLVDVVFLLVLFFAASTTFLETSGLKLDLPEATATTRPPLQPIRVSVDRQGHVIHEGQRLSDAELERVLRELLPQAAEKTVLLQADAGASHGRVVQVMDRIRRAGAEGLTVATRPAREQGGDERP